MNHLQLLIKTFTSPHSKFFMPMNEFISELATLAPYIIGKKNELPEPSKDSRILPVPGANLTEYYDSQDIHSNSIAYYRVSGTIIADSRWYDSSKKLLNNLLRADDNERISAHFIHITSGGGEAWLLDQLAQTIHNLKKPAHAFIERIAGSAAYYIASQCDYISASTPFDIVGSIGTMVSFMDLQPMLEKWGINFIEEYASQSDLKNKKYHDLTTGKPEQYITEELDPLAARFIADVKRGRVALKSAKDDNPVFRGETFYADKAIKAGLIDTIESYSDAVNRLNATANSSNKNIRARALNLLDF